MGTATAVHSPESLEERWTKFVASHRLMGHRTLWSVWICGLEMQFPHLFDSFRVMNGILWINSKRRVAHSRPRGVVKIIRLSNLTSLIFIKFFFIHVIQSTFFPDIYYNKAAYKSVSAQWEIFVIKLITSDLNQFRLLSSDVPLSNVSQ